MHIKSLSLINFKNYSSAVIEPDPGANAFVGGNGEGKTNLLDAIYFLALCKSYFNHPDTHLIKQGEDFFVLQATFELNEMDETISAGFKRGQKKVFKRNQQEYERLADHIGLLPIVIITPTDSGLITEGSEERRKFLDSMISQFDHRYLDDLIIYTRVLSQRNAYLKQAAKSRSFDLTSLEIWDDQLIPLGRSIHATRKKFIDEMLPVFGEHYEFISMAKETVDIRYESHLNANDFAGVLRDSVEKDRAFEYTTTGIHKDDLVFMINGFPVKRFASQGQQKSFLISLKLAQFILMRRRKGMTPILLLDDIFEKLDENRVARLMELVNKDSFGQIFITDTHGERVRQLFETLNLPVRCFPVTQGNIELVEC